jgi:hypothetical protein
MNLRHANQELLRVRGWRNPRSRDLSIVAAVGDARVAAERASRSTSSLDRAWAAACPAELAGRAWPLSCARGVLTVRVSDAAARWELDRWLRSGGERELARAARVAIRRTRLVLQ